MTMTHFSFCNPFVLLPFLFVVLFYHLSEKISLNDVAYHRRLLFKKFFLTNESGLYRIGLNIKIFETKKYQRQVKTTGFPIYLDV